MALRSARRLAARRARASASGFSGRGRAVGSAAGRRAGRFRGAARLGRAGAMGLGLGGTQRRRTIRQSASGLRVVRRIPMGSEREAQFRQAGGRPPELPDGALLAREAPARRAAVRRGGGEPPDGGVAPARLRGGAGRPGGCAGRCRPEGRGAAGARGRPGRRRSRRPTPRSPRRSTSASATSEARPHGSGRSTGSLPSRQRRSRRGAGEAVSGKPSSWRARIICTGSSARQDRGGSGSRA